MSKIKVTKEIAEAIESSRNDWTDDTILIQHTERKYLSSSDPINNPLDKLHFVELARALYGGYSIELTLPKNVIEYLKFEKENLLNIIGDNMNEFNKGRVYAMDKMIIAVENIYFTDHQTMEDLAQEIERQLSNQ